MPAMTATSTAGILGKTRCSAMMSTSAPRPTPRAHRLVLPAMILSHVAAISASSPSASMENPASLRTWPTRMVSARPFM